MAITATTPPYPGGDWKAWALQMVAYLQRTAPIAELNAPGPVLLARRDDNSRAAKEGILLFDQVAKYPVVSINSVWEPLLTQADADARYAQTGDMSAYLPLTGGDLTGLLNMSTSSPQFHYIETDQAAGLKRWTTLTSAGVFYIAARNDDGTPISGAGSFSLYRDVAGLTDVRMTPSNPSLNTYSVLNVARADTRYLQLSGGTLSGAIVAPVGGAYHYKFANEAGMAGPSTGNLALKGADDAVNNVYYGGAGGPATASSAAVILSRKMADARYVNLVGDSYINGNIGVGVTATSSETIRAAANDTTSAYYAIRAYTASSGGSVVFAARGDGRVTVGAGTYNATVASAASVYIDSNGYLSRSTSARRYKTNIAALDGGLETVMRLRPVTFDSLAADDQGRNFSGFIAEEVGEVIPTAHYDDTYDHRAVLAHLVKAVQELNAKLEALTNG